MSKPLSFLLSVVLLVCSGCWIIKPRISPEPLTASDANELISRGTVMVHFWSTWCKPCVAELAELNLLNAFALKRGVTIIGVAIDDSVSDVEKFTRFHPVDFPVTVDSAGRWKARFRIDSVPQTVFLKEGLTVIQVIAPTGETVSILKGPQPWASPFGKSAIDSLDN